MERGTLLGAPHFPASNPSGRSCVSDLNLCVAEGRVWLAVMGDAEIYNYWFCMCDIRDDDDGGAASEVVMMSGGRYSENGADDGDDDGADDGEDGVGDYDTYNGFHGTRSSRRT